MPVSYTFDDYGNELLPPSKTVSQLNEYIKMLIEEEVQLQDVYVTAEISNFKYHSTGHMYFTLKDENSEIKAVMFRAYASRLKFRPENGIKILAHARVGVYEKAGSYQLYVDTMQPDGIGSLYLAYEQLKAKLSAEGLFNEDHKRSIPTFPKRLGVITSPTGAAVRDIIKVAKNRCPFIDILIYPSAVQGRDAPFELMQAVDHFNLLDNVDVIIIGRGGGSIEDLWAFNDENLARAIFNSHIPIISAVGHEIDFTICDFVADMRAATPSHAAEIAVPDCAEYIIKLKNIALNLKNNISRQIEDLKKTLEAYKSSRVLSTPFALFDEKRMELLDIFDKLEGAMRIKQKEYRYLLENCIGKLNALNPLSILSRGYGAVFKSSGEIVRTVKDIKVDEDIIIMLSDGEVCADVNKIIEKDI